MIIPSVVASLTNSMSRDALRGAPSFAFFAKRGIRRSVLQSCAAYEIPRGASLWNPTSRKGRETLRLRSGQAMGHPLSWRRQKKQVPRRAFGPVRNDSLVFLVDFRFFNTLHEAKARFLLLGSFTRR